MLAFKLIYYHDCLKWFSKFYRFFKLFFNFLLKVTEVLHFIFLFCKLFLVRLTLWKSLSFHKLYTYCFNQNKQVSLLKKRTCWNLSIRTRDKHISLTRFLSLAFGFTRLDFSTESHFIGCSLSQEGFLT